MAHEHEGHIEDVDNGTDQDPTVEKRCIFCGRYYFHTTHCPNFEPRTSDNVDKSLPHFFDGDEEC